MHDVKRDNISTLSLALAPACFSAGLVWARKPTAARNSQSKRFHRVGDFLLCGFVRWHRGQPVCVCVCARQAWIHAIAEQEGGTLIVIVFVLTEVHNDGNLLLMKSNLFSIPCARVPDQAPVTPTVSIGIFASSWWTSFVCSQ